MKLHLILDADDTLWENNIYFEDAFDEFTEFLAHSRLQPHEVRAALDEIELANARIHGYGSKNFGRNLRECFERLSERGVRDGDLDTVMSFAERILECPMQVLSGVEETLAYLAPRHELTLFTKGHPDEQKLKLDRSELGGYFAHTAIVKEKDSAAYRKLVEERGFDPRRSWMIGNSPKSDINPALECGLNAVFVPHARTWGLEREEIRPGAGKLIVVEQFSDLRNHF
jgi:putative hydrolase of the HAD superfamily